MNKFQKVTVSDVTENFDNIRIPLSSKQRKNLKKIYPYYGAQNIIDYVEDYLFDGEYILIAEDGENLKSANSQICNLVSGKFWVNNHAHILKATNENDTKYLYYYLNLINFRQFITGSAQPKLTKDNLSAIPLNIHYPKDQKIISSILSILDKKIKLNNKINAELEAMVKLLYDYWFVQFDFPDKNGKPYKSNGGKMVWSKELKNDIPLGWEIKKLCNLVKNSVKQINPLDYPNKQFKYYSIPSYDSNGGYEIEIGNNIKSSKYLIEELDVLVSKLNPRFSRIIYALNDDNQISSTEFVIWRSNSIFLKNFLYLIASSERFQSFCISRAAGSSGSHKRVNPKVMMNYQIPYNELFIEKYGQSIDPILKKIVILKKENKELKELRDWLLPMLMNGQVRVD